MLNTTKLVLAQGYFKTEPSTVHFYNRSKKMISTTFYVVENAAPVQYSVVTVQITMCQTNKSSPISN